MTAIERNPQMWTADGAGRPPVAGRTLRAEARRHVA
jgi:hypothetical protein